MWRNECFRIDFDNDCMVVVATDGTPPEPANPTGRVADVFQSGAVFQFNLEDGGCLKVRAMEPEGCILVRPFEDFYREDSSRNDT
jgi:hypothetical protein